MMAILIGLRFARQTQETPPRPPPIPQYKRGRKDAPSDNWNQSDLDKRKSELSVYQTKTRDDLDKAHRRNYSPVTDHIPHSDINDAASSSFPSFPADDPLVLLTSRLVVLLMALVLLGRS